MLGLKFGLGMLIGNGNTTTLTTPIRYIQNKEKKNKYDSFLFFFHKMLKLIARAIIPINQWV